MLKGRQQKKPRNNNAGSRTNSQQNNVRNQQASSLSNSQKNTPLTSKQNGHHQEPTTVVEVTDDKTNSTAIGTVVDKPGQPKFIILSRSLEKQNGSLPLPSDFGPITESDKTISDLTDQCLLHLFHAFPLQVQVVYLRLVCKRWRNILHQHFRTVESLKLFGSVPKFTNYLDIYRSLASLNMCTALEPEGERSLIASEYGLQKQDGAKMFIRFAHSRFPNIREFVMYCTQFSEQDLARVFSGKWRYQLELFGLFQNPYDEFGQNFKWHLVYPAISLASNLKHLLLCDIRGQKPYELAQLMSQLETLYLGYHSKSIFKVVNYLGKNIRKLVLFHDALEGLSEEPFSFVKIRRPIKKNLESLALYVGIFGTTGQSMDFALLEYICKMFHNIKVFDFGVAELEFEFIIECLGKLKNLKAIRFHVDLAENDSMSSLAQYRSAPLPTFLKLPSVTQLAIQNPLGPTGSLAATFSLFPLIFPNLEFLHLVNCPIYCEPNHSQTPCSACDDVLMNIIFLDFPKFRRYRQLRYKQIRKVKLPDGNVMEAFEPHYNVYDCSTDDMEKLVEWV